jgi:hypothetical protein
MRVGNKTPAMTVNKTVKTGTDKSSNCSPHVATGNKTVTGGTAVHGMPLMSAAAPKAKY